LQDKKPVDIEFWTGIRHKIPTCCIIFYETVWLPSLKNQIAEYGKAMTQLTNNEGVIMCPDCLVAKMTNMKKLTIALYS